MIWLEKFISWIDENYPSMKKFIRLEWIWVTRFIFVALTLLAIRHPVFYSEDSSLLDKAIVVVTYIIFTLGLVKFERFIRKLLD